MLRILLMAALPGVAGFSSASALAAELPASSACAPWITESVVSPQGDMAYERIPFEVLYHYRQKAYGLDDPMGDYALASQGAFTPQAILWALKGEKETRRAFDRRIAEAEPCGLEFFRLPPHPNPAPEPKNAALFEKQAEIDQIRSLRVPDAIKARMLDDYRSGRLDLEGHSNPIRRTPFTRMILQIIAEEQRAGAVHFFEGESHRWSQEFKDRHIQKFFPFTMAPKLLVALSRGDTAKFMVTGKETRLEQWILDQPYRSLLPEQVIRKSYVLNAGNLYLSLLTIENVFARHWRNPDRARLPVTLRLKPIINHFGIRGDDFGTWYHFFGILLYGYVYGQNFQSELNSISIAFTETLGSHVLDRFQNDEAQEDWINDMGARVGFLLRRRVQAGEHFRLPSEPGSLKTESYLDLNESFEARLYDYARRLQMQP